MVDDHESKKRQIIQLIKNAAPKAGSSPIREAAGDDRECDCGRRIKSLKFLLVVSLIASTIVQPIVTIFFSISSVVIALILISGFRRQIGRRFAATCLALTLASTVTGCSPLLSDLNPEIAKLCETKYEQTGDACRFGISKGIKVFGIPIRRASVEGAAFDGGISEIFATQMIQGAGIVSVDVVRVYGS